MPPVILSRLLTPSEGAVLCFPKSVTTNAFLTRLSKLLIYLRVVYISCRLRNDQFNFNLCLVSPSLISDIKNHQIKWYFIKTVGNWLEYRCVTTKHILLFILQVSTFYIHRIHRSANIPGKDLQLLATYFLAVYLYLQMKTEYFIKSEGKG